jgi:hypothetical protein
MGCGEGSLACSWSLTHQRSDIRAHKSKRDLEDGGKASGWCAAPPALESFCVCYSQRNGGTAKSYDKSWVGSKWDVARVRWRDTRPYKSKRDVEDGGKASGWCAAPPALESFCVCYPALTGRANLCRASGAGAGRRGRDRREIPRRHAEAARLYWDDNENRDEVKTAKCVGSRSLAALRDDNLNRSNDNNKSRSNGDGKETKAWNITTEKSGERPEGTDRVSRKRRLPGFCG